VTDVLGRRDDVERSLRVLYEDAALGSSPDAAYLPGRLVRRNGAHVPIVLQQDNPPVQFGSDRFIEEVDGPVLLTDAE